MARMYMRLAVIVAVVTGAWGYLPENCQLQIGSSWQGNGLSDYIACVTRNAGLYAAVYQNQPTCAVLDAESAVNKAVAKIDKNGVLQLSDNSTLNYHLKGVVSFYAIDPFQTRIYAVFTGVQGFYDDSEFFSLHVHELGEINSNCLATGGHFNPCGKSHSDDPHATNRHVGDVAKVSLEQGSDVLVIDRIDTQVKLSGALSVTGRSVTVHAGHKSARVGCATIGITRWDGDDQRHPDTYFNAEPPTEFWKA